MVNTKLPLSQIKKRYILHNKQFKPRVIQAQAEIT